ncbi:hypothetical protein KKC88_01380 [Patescibacteria group bacterium]|nr:hypothetical protein [Patescibacteria group bacterium]MBU1673479.1 hypothetical protein [Patescibacteria group bacterium]MBU1963990.1 hypothetical protein [Patescibacteria group bacterium]
MAKVLVFLISTKGKKPEEIAKQGAAAIRKFERVRAKVEKEQPARQKAVKKPAN